MFVFGDEEVGIDGDVLGLVEADRDEKRRDKFVVGVVVGVGSTILDRRHAGRGRGLRMEIDCNRQHGKAREREKQPKKSAPFAHVNDPLFQAFTQPQRGR